MTEVIHLATAINDRYLLPLQVMIASLVEHLKPATQPVLHVVQRSLSTHSRETLSALIETRFVTPTETDTALIPPHESLPPEAAFPVLLPGLLPELERVLFLDADLLVLDDVTALWETKLEGKAHAAVADSAVRLCSARRGVAEWRELAIPRDHAYFNGGVMLIDLEAWRRRTVTARTLSFLDTHLATTDFLHQGALNATMWDDWLPLDRRWNLFGTVAGRRGDAPATNPGIVHFAGRMKPWLAAVGGPFESTYWATMVRLGLERPPADLWRRSLSVYDRYARDRLRPLERFAWRRRWI
jgi:lipopolysaccharide biosynthesis glycosyltransferase